MTDRIGEPLDETTLRRALRLEADERPPLFDPAAIAAAAQVRPRIAIVSAAVAVGLGAVGALSLVAALAIATAHELRERVSHVNAS